MSSVTQTKAGSSPAHPMTHFAAGGIGAAIGAIVTCPLDVAKTRLQSSRYAGRFSQPLSNLSASVLGSSSSGSSLNFGKIAASTIRPFRECVQVISDTARQEGIGALWKGLGPNLLGVVPARALYFSSYSVTKNRLLTFYPESSAIHLLSAATAGFFVATTTAPVWLVKTRMQLQNRKDTTGVIYRNSFHCLKSVIKEEGFFTLYRGLGASYLGVAEGTLQFVIYEKLKQIFDTRERLILAQDDTFASAKEWLRVLSFAAVAKFVAALITYPHEVIRTRLRESPPPGQPRKYVGIVNTFKLIVKEEGAAAMYGGIGAHLMRVVPNAAIMFGGYEAIVWFASKTTA